MECSRSNFGNRSRRQWHQICFPRATAVAFRVLKVKSIICYGYSFQLHQQANAIQMGPHNTCLYNEVDKKYTSCNLKTTELLECVLIGVCAVIRLNTVSTV